MNIDRSRLLPSSWQMGTVEDLCSSVADGDHQPPPQVDSGIPFLVIGNVRSGRVDFTNTRFVPKDYYEALTATRQPRRGDVLYTVTGSFGIPVLVDSDRPFCVQRHVAILKPSSLPLAPYLTYALSTGDAFAQASAMATGTAQKTVGLKNLRKIEVPVAPLPEQHRIVQAIETNFTKLDAAEATLKRIHSNLKRYRASVLKAAVEGTLVPTEAELARQENRDYEPASVLLDRIEPPPRPNRYKSRSKDITVGHASLAVGRPDTDLPEGWEWTALLDVARLESGHTPSRNHPEWWNGDVPWIGIRDARDHHGGVIHDTSKHTNEDGLANSAARWLPKDTICLSRTASVGYVFKLGRPMVTSQDFVNWISTDAIVPDWLRCVLMADKEVLRRFGKGTVHKTIYFPEVLSFHIAVPPLAEQRRIVAEVDRAVSAIDAAELTLTTNGSRLGRLRQSILKLAFEGKLVPQDPRDEPASVLLKRIKADREAMQAKHKKTRRPRKKTSQLRVSKK